METFDMKRSDNDPLETPEGKQGGSNWFLNFLGLSWRLAWLVAVGFVSISLINSFEKNGIGRWLLGLACVVSFLSFMTVADREERRKKAAVKADGPPVDDAGTSPAPEKPAGSKQGGFRISWSRPLAGLSVLILFIGASVLVKDLQREIKAEKINQDGLTACDAKDFETAAKHFRAAAELGYAAAQCNLGSLLLNGRGGVEKDEVEAVKWFRKAAKQGDRAAQCLLGDCYAQGRGVEQDEAEAVKWYRKAANTKKHNPGLPGVQRRLGDCYAQGRGVEQDFEKAAIWYRKAAERGDERAAVALDRLGSE